MNGAGLQLLAQQKYNKCFTQMKIMLHYNFFYVRSEKKTHQKAETAAFLFSSKWRTQLSAHRQRGSLHQSSSERSG